MTGSPVAVALLEIALRYMCEQNDRLNRAGLALKQGNELINWSAETGLPRSSDPLPLV